MPVRSEEGKVSKRVVEGDSPSSRDGDARCLAGHTEGKNIRRNDGPVV